MDKLSISIKKILSELAKNISSARFGGSGIKTDLIAQRLVFARYPSCRKIGYFNVGQKFTKNYQKKGVRFNHTLGSTLLFPAARYVRIKIGSDYH